MPYLVRYESGSYGLKPFLEAGDEIYTEVSDDFKLRSDCDYEILIEGGYKIVERPPRMEDQNIEAVG